MCVWVGGCALCNGHMAPTYVRGGHKCHPWGDLECHGGDAALCVSVCVCVCLCVSVRCEEEQRDADTYIDG